MVELSTHPTDLNRVLARLAPSSSFLPPPSHITPPLPTHPTPNPTRSAPTQLVHGPIPCGELARGCGSLIYPLTTPLPSPTLSTFLPARAPLWQLGSTSTATIGPEGG